jgi:hypothetical protein
MMLEVTYKGMQAISCDTSRFTKRVRDRAARWLYQHSYIYTFEEGKLIVLVTKWGAASTMKAIEAALAAN